MYMPSSLLHHCMYTLWVACIQCMDDKSLINFRFLSISPTQFNRQTYVWSQCSSDEDCIPIEYQNVTIPTSLISCNTSSGLCKCQKCFIRSKDVCKINRNACNKFMADTSECSDDRKFQKTTLLLSVFLSATGAANFYIGQNILGL